MALAGFVLNTELAVCNDTPKFMAVKGKVKLRA